MKITREEEFTAAIAEQIATNPPVVEFSKNGVDEAYRRLGRDGVALLKSKGFLGYDFEKYYVIERFLNSLGITEKADDKYLSAVFSSSAKFSAKQFRSDPYLKKIKVLSVREGDFLLTESSYERGEIFQYDMPDLSLSYIVPKLGFLTESATFPTIYEGNVPWMSVCPSEIYSMKPHVLAASGRVLVLGLGLGYFPFMISRKSEVKSIVIVELREEVIKIFNDHILPQFPFKEKIEVVRADALKYLASTADGQFDYCFADIWENQFDGAVYYKEIKPFEEKLPSTRFSYWIEKEILFELERQKNP